MSWRSTGRTNEELVNNLRSHNVISSDRVHSVMMTVDRGYFIGHNPYEDRPQSIGYSATISAPHMHAYTLNVLEPKLQPGARVLDVGSGSGILTACFALMVGPNGLAVGIEHVEELTHLSARNIQNWLNSRPMYNGSAVDCTLGNNILLVTGDGRQGYPPHAPYDLIHVGAAAPSIPQEVILHCFYCLSHLLCLKTIFVIILQDHRSYQIFENNYSIFCVNFSCFFFWNFLCRIAKYLPIKLSV
ncbi:unnamed protein product [Rodentolepis nana]|uniref:protein-L-isoaspartate(D-aspartate) O-methyltransferase n=1 Tax=Rodentolepis nana TaxID=102285 RepID=A0A0R3T551_RODNA|nr:unnamed protein product [Rodentolepis nana]